MSKRRLPRLHLAACIVFLAGISSATDEEQPKDQTTPQTGLSRFLYRNRGNLLFAVPDLVAGEDRWVLASPDRRFCLYVSGENHGPRRLFVCDLQDPIHRNLLLENYRFFSALWSWNSRKIAVNSEFASGGCEPHVYAIEKGRGSSFTVNEIDFSTTPLAYLQRLTKGRIYFKNWIGVVDWASDNSSLLLNYYSSWRQSDVPGDISLRAGHEEGYFTYNLQTRAFSPDGAQFKTLVPALDQGADLPESRIAKLLVPAGRTMEHGAPIGVVAWRRDRKAYILTIPLQIRPPQLRSSLDEPSVILCSYVTETGAVEPAEEVPLGWVTRCNYVRALWKTAEGRAER